MVDVFLTPDLGWANRTRMLNPAYNSAVSTVDTAAMDVTTDADLGYISLSCRVITIGPVKYKIPFAFVGALTGNNIRYYYTIGDGVISSFVLRKSTGSV